MNGLEKRSLASEILEQLPLAKKTAVWGTLGTIRPHLGFDAEKDAQTFFEAVSGEGIKNGVVINLLTNRSNEHRQQIAEAFLNFTQQSLLKTLEAVVSGQLETILMGLLCPAAQYDAHEIKAGLQGLEVETLIEIASTRTAQQLQEILDYYKQDFKTDLEMDIASGTTGGFKDLLIALIKGKRECYSGIIDYALIRQDSKALAEAAAGGDAGQEEESEWIRILTQRSPEHLKRVFSRYHKMTGTPVEETMGKHFQGHFQEAGLTLASLLRNTPLYFATKLYQAIKDAGRSPRTVARIMISRSETDLLSIRTEFKRHYGISLYSLIGAETKGDYQAALLSLCKAEDL
ncbi:annexin A9 [Candoia aspera]|uniref:annexin A9 n=1 Tax=Candoia aspera TaxID=51853 RepID=UPI002FD7CD31